MTTHVDIPHASEGRLDAYPTRGVTVATTPSSESMDLPHLRRGRSMFKQRVLTADFVVASTATVVAARLWAGSGATALPEHRWIFVIGLLALPLLLGNCGLYCAGLLARRASELRRLASAIALWFVGLVLLGSVTATPPANGLFLVVAAAAFVALAFEREVVRRIFERLRASGYIVRRAIRVGDRSGVYDIAKSTSRRRAGTPLPAPY